ncbi:MULTISPECIES: helix-turn-helix domain-containing protein [Paenibacillus]|uniref:Helix-turn-helix domain-containing protein n=1 Tax=Paenibacillus lutrae TaxID=2078573 RepID=A0A7X3K184_9BACL|nr:MULTISPECIES: helix-turn-helix transcriptional regulator [Paenibacillus]MVP01973.1 helix-turn-helix domain-containing protein [Paenibacillus lutrae]
MDKQNEFLKMLGARIKSLRAEKGYTQEQLAEAMQTSYSYVAAIERGTKNVTVETLYKIAHALDTTVQELFTYEETMYQQSSKDTAMRILELLAQQNKSDSDKAYRILLELFR